MTAAVVPGQVVYYPPVGFPGGCGVGSLPGTSANMVGFARGSRGRFRLLYPLLPLQLLRGPLISNGMTDAALHLGDRQRAKPSVVRHRRLEVQPFEDAGVCLCVDVRL